MHRVVHDKPNLRMFLRASVILLPRVYGLRYHLFFVRSCLGPTSKRVSVCVCVCFKAPRNFVVPIFHINYWLKGKRATPRYFHTLDSLSFKRTCLCFQMIQILLWNSQDSEIAPKNSSKVLWNTGTELTFVIVDFFFKWKSKELVVYIVVFHFIEAYCWLFDLCRTRTV